MDRTDAMVEQHVRQYQARLRRIDELLERAETVGGQSPAARSELVELRRERDRLADKFTRGSDNRWETEAMGEFGPMGIWDTVAEKIEHLIERLSGGSR